MSLLFIRQLTNYILKKIRNKNEQTVIKGENFGFIRNFIDLNIKTYNFFVNKSIRDEIYTDSESLLEINFLGRLFGSIKMIYLDDSNLIITLKNGQKQECSLSEIYKFPIYKNSIFGGKVIFSFKSKDITLPNLSTKTALFLIFILENKVAFNIKEPINKSLRMFKEKTKDKYLRDSDINNLDKELINIIEAYESNKEKIKNIINSDIFDEIIELYSVYPISVHKELIRQKFEQKQLKIKEYFFNKVESNPLTEQQRLSVIRNNDINLVLAAAGTGKTSVMIAKTLDLIISGEAKSEEILILAYSDAAKKELSDRLIQRAELADIDIVTKPEIFTFHSLGRRIIKDTGHSVDVSKLAEDTFLLEQWLSTWLTEYIKKSSDNLFNFIELAYQPCNPFDFQTMDEYNRYINEKEFRTLNGEKVSGYQELLIANWLFLNGIPYEYEARYISKCRIEVGIDYKPDFDLKNGVYLEHFGIDRNGGTRKDIDATKYNEQIIKKRELHKEHGTVLLETYHYDWTENKLLIKLEEIIKQQNIPIVPMPEEEIFTKLNEIQIFSENVKRYRKCLAAIRAERLSYNDILARLNMRGILFADRYTDLLMNIHDAFVAYLKSKNEIDFDDMILKSTVLIKKDEFKPRWKHILVDEFQDISMARLELLKEIYTKGPNPIWTAVGDDWQSIYRFSGGKLEVTTRFNDIIGSHTLSKLEKTYRYNNSIANTAGTFIMQNPEQYIKEVVTNTQVQESSVHLHDSFVSSDTNCENEKVIEDISQKTLQIVNEIRAKEANPSIAILARYNYLLADVQRVIKDKHIKFWTFHKSKGLEADYCILLGFFRGKNGFPTGNKNEEIVEALLPSLDKYPHSEERRLLYVALTRAKKESHLISSATAPSEFIEELLSPQYDINIKSDYFKRIYRDTFKCKICSTGYFVLRTGKYGDFYSCSTGELCRSKPRICEKCGSPSIDFHTVSRCQKAGCHTEIQICDKCGRPMRLRDGKSGKFWGCSGYAIEEDQCKNTRKYRVA